MPKDESRPRKSREDLDFGPYTKHSTTRSGENVASTSNTGGTDKLSVVLGDGSGSASSSHLVHSRDTKMIPVGLSEPSQLQPLGSFFQMSKNVNVNGGEFNSSRLHHTTLTINIGRNDASGSGDSSVRETGSDGRRDASRTQDNLGNNYHSDYRDGTSDSGYARGDNSYNRQESPSLTYLPVQRISHVYFKNLSTSGRGSPLWAPEPNDNLPIEYQRKGIGIGDVGIITDSGGFDFLFNICLPEDNPINPSPMPLNFKPLAYPEPKDVYGNMDFKPDSYLTSSLVEALRRNEGEFPSRGLEFESFAKDGAVLTMPAGSRSTDVRKTAPFRKYATENVERWYQYANEDRGREARNGDLRLVIGYHSASVWGMAAFSRLSEQNASPIRLSYARPPSRTTTSTTENDNYPVGARMAGQEWQCSGPATAVEAKFGPLLAGGGSSEPDVYENQALFIRTINLTLHDDVWNKLSKGWEMDIGLDDHASEETGGPSSARAGDRFGGVNMPSDGALNRTHTSEASGRESQRRRLSDDISMDDKATLARQNRNPSSRHGVYISYPRGALDLHPSTAINKCLLKEKPNMRMAITEDADWNSVLNPDEAVLPQSEILFSRIVGTREICEDDGVIFFKPHVHAPSTPPQPLSKGILESQEGLLQSESPSKLSSSMMFSKTSNSAQIIPTRTQIACLLCREKKVKCFVENGESRCQRCIKNGVESCVFEGKRFIPPRRAPYMQQIRLEVERPTVSLDHPPGQYHFHQAQNMSTFVDNINPGFWDPGQPSIYSNEGAVSPSGDAQQSMAASSQYAHADDEAAEDCES